MTQGQRSLLPIGAMTIGAAGYTYLSHLSAGIPYILAGMLFFTFLRLRPSELRLRREHLFLYGIQLMVSAAGYLVLLPIDPLWAQAILLCLITPVATASPAIVGILGGDVGFVTTFVLLSHILTTMIVPLLFPCVGQESTVGFWMMAWQIFKVVFPLIIVPIIVAQLMRWRLPDLSSRINGYRGLPFMLWLCSLLLLLAHTVAYVVDRPEIGWETIVQMSLVGLGCCVGQLTLGHFLAIAMRLEPDATRQAMGQKNTTLAIWLSLLFLNPITSLSSTAYIIVQNFAISLLLRRSSRGREA